MTALLEKENSERPCGHAGPQLVTVAAIPGEDHSSPTGQVFNGGGGFDLINGDETSSSTFIFATEDGTISGWNKNVNPTSSVIKVDKSGDVAVYKGLAIGTNHDGTFLFAANFNSGKVDVFDQNFKQVDSFTDKHLPKGYAPFNVQVLDGHLFVTFALQDAGKHDDVGRCRPWFCGRVRPGRSLDPTGGIARTARFSVGACDRALRLWRACRRSSCRKFR